MRAVAAPVWATDACTPVCDAAAPGASYANDAIVCAMAPAVGTGFEVRIRGVWVPLGATLGYAPPAIARVEPGVVGIDGGSVTLVGSGFGSAGCAALASLSPVTVTVSTAPSTTLLFDVSWTSGGGVSTTAGTTPASASGSGGGPVGFPRVATTTTMVCAVTAWADDRVVCEAPPGYDADVAVSIVVGGQSASVASGYSYAGPTITGLTGGASVPTAGGAVVELTGSGFAAPSSGWPTVVLVGYSLCPIVDVTPTRITCTAPPGSGSAVVVVYTPLQQSDAIATSPWRISYAGPVITAVAPAPAAAHRPVTGGFAVSLSGENFYPGATNVTITSSVSCAAVADDTASGAAMTTACDHVVVDGGSSRYRSLTCVAPPGCGTGELTVSVRGLQDGAVSIATAAFVYDGPTVVAVENRTTDAMQTTTLSVTGTNFGVSGQALPSVVVGTWSQCC